MLSHYVQKTYSFSVSDTVIEAVVGLKIGAASVPLWLNVSFGSRIGQEIMRLSGANADETSCGRRQHGEILLQRCKINKDVCKQPV